MSTTSPSQRLDRLPAASITATGRSAPSADGATARFVPAPCAGAEQRRRRRPGPVEDDLLGVSSSRRPRSWIVAPRLARWASRQGPPGLAVQRTSASCARPAGASGFAGGAGCVFLAGGVITAPPLSRRGGRGRQQRKRDDRREDGYLVLPVRSFPLRDERCRSTATASKPSLSVAYGVSCRARAERVCATASEAVPSRQFALGRFAPRPDGHRLGRAVPPFPAGFLL